MQENKPLIRVQHGLLLVAGGVFGFALSWLYSKPTPRQQQHSPESRANDQQTLQSELDHEREKRAADRAGRIRAEKEVKSLQMQLLTLQQQLSASASATVDTSTVVAPGASQGTREAGPAQPLMAYPFRPIGFVRSCFTQRNGTPRQPQLVPAARCVIDLTSDIPHYCFEGLEQYSHVWVIYVFHENTDLAKALSPDRGQGIKAKIRVPRLDGGRMGVLATRSPHRPAPIGLSVARVIGVRGRTLILGGADMVHGSPVLDIKPYVPYCDALPQAEAPSWVVAEGDDDPLQLSGVQMTPDVEQQLARSWRASKKTSLYDSPEEFIALVKQVLSRDIRSVHQRVHLAHKPKVVASSITAEDKGMANGVDGEGKEVAKPDTTAGQLPVDMPGQKQDTVAEQHEAGTLGQEPALQGTAEEGQLGRVSKAQGAATLGQQVGLYHVVLEHVQVSYDVEDDGIVYIRGACVWQAAGTPP